MRTWFGLLVCSLILTLGAAVRAQQPAPAAASEEQRLADAKTHFERGVEHSQRSEWDAALAEFLRSREIFPTTKATYNAAVVLRKVNRFDEALDMYEALLRDFPNLAQQEKQIAMQELAQLRAAIGIIELTGVIPGAKISIDGRDRGTYPPGLPLRVGAGSHTVRISADGYLPFEARVDVAGTQKVPISVQLVALASGGRVRVTEQTGKVLDVVVDNTAIGKTPWEGLLAPGDHTVLLRGEGNVGTQPVRASVKLNQLVNLNLLSEQLDASLRVQPTPASATVIVDSVPVGHGAWDGRLRSGAHVIEVTADGYLPFKKELDLKTDASESVVATLERDPTVFAQQGRASLGIELDVALPLGAIFGGDLSGSCTGSCSASLPLGMHSVIHGVYQTASGFGVGVDLGYLLTFRTLEGRATTVQPVGIAPNQGTADDKLRFGGLTVGGSAQYHRGVEWPVVVRVGVGALFASTSDARTGNFTNTTFNEPYTTSSRETASAAYLYVAPELRIGRRFGEHFELNVGVELLLLTAFSTPKWANKASVPTTNFVTSCSPAQVPGEAAQCGAERRRQQADGSGTYPAQSIAGTFMMFIAPGIGARYDF